MAISKENYKKALEYYRQWNEAELKERIRNAGKMTPEQGWQQYVDLWEFCINLNPGAGKGQHLMTLTNLHEYYASIQKFERLRPGGTKA